MGVIIIFLPCDLYRADSGYLFGAVRILSNGSTVFYILGCSGKATLSDTKIKSKFIGTFQSDTNRESVGLPPLQNHWLNVQLQSNEFMISGITINEKLVSDSSTPVISIIFDPQTFLSSELLESTACPSLDEDRAENIDYFNVLTNLLYELKQDSGIDVAEFFLHGAFLQFLLLTSKILNPLFRLSQKCFFILKISRICCHFVYFLESVIWCLSTYLTMKKFTLKAGNYIFGRILDAVLGILALYYLMENFTSDELFQSMANVSEDIVKKLGIIIHWLMGSPAGLKLNAPLTNLLGQFFLYHVNLWWSFLVVTRPMLEIIYAVFLRIGFLGLSFQVSILSDLLMFTSFHIYCIYVYAARLFNIQLKFLFHLFRLVIGRKRNPLPGQVDSDPYTTEQLFIGTLAFTILLFLLPTTFVYYLMFAILRVVLVAVGGLLARVNFLLQTLPVFVTYQWLFNSPRTTNSIDLRPKTLCPQSNRVVLNVRPVTTSLWSIILSTIPDAVKFPKEVDWPHIIQSLVSGRLIYTI